MARSHLRRCVLVLGVAAATAFAFGGVAEAVSLAVCTTDSQPGAIIASAPCGIYGEIQTRTETAGPIWVRFMTHAPAGTPKGIVLLLPGGLGGAGLSGTPGLPPAGNGPNFLVRSAQLQAEDGYLAVTMGRPLINNDDNTPQFPGSDHDLYRVTSRHAFDIVSVLANVVAGNPAAYAPLYRLVEGTSRSTLSAVAQSKLFSGILLSSPLTTGVVAPCPPGQSPPCPPFFIGHPDVPNLHPGYVTVGAHVMAHKDDTCSATLPVNAKALHQQFVNAGFSSQYNELHGGFTMVGQIVPPDPNVITVCDALTYHGFLGIEAKAVKTMTKRADQILNALRRRNRGNRRPVALPGAMSAPSFLIDLAPLVSDPDGDPLTVFLPHAFSNRGAQLVLNGSVVSYIPAAGLLLPDGFVYVASDGRGGVSPAIVTVTAGP